MGGDGAVDIELVQLQPSPRLDTLLPGEEIGVLREQNVELDAQVEAASSHSLVKPSEARLPFRSCLAAPTAPCSETIFCQYVGL